MNSGFSLLVLPWPTDLMGLSRTLSGQQVSMSLNTTSPGTYHVVTHYMVQNHKDALRPFQGICPPLSWMLAFHRPCFAVSLILWPFYERRSCIFAPSFIKWSLKITIEKSCLLQCHAYCPVPTSVSPFEGFSKGLCQYFNFCGIRALMLGILKIERVWHSITLWVFLLAETMRIDAQSIPNGMVITEGKEITDRPRFWLLQLNCFIQHGL